MAVVVRSAWRGCGERERQGQHWNPAGCSEPRPQRVQPLLSRTPSPPQNVPFIAVTSFLCLRFFSPAIMAPKLFHLRERHADARTSRTLLLLAKVRARGHWRDSQPGAPGRGEGWPGQQCVPHRLQECL